MRRDLSIGNLLASIFVLASQMLSPEVPDVVSVELKPETLEGFESYVRATQARIDKQRARPENFLYIDGFRDPKRGEVQAALKRGDVFMEPLITRDGLGREIAVPGGLIHHWVGGVFIPGMSLRQVLESVQDYDHHQYVYPEVIRSRLISRHGNDFKVALRFRYKKIITVTLNTEHDVRYTELDPTHWYSRSTSTRIAEVKNAGSPDESEKPVGHDGGFLWRINSYWGFVERDGGVYVECESVSLTRNIPTGLGWLIRPFVTSIPRQSLQHTLDATHTAARARVAGTPGSSRTRGERHEAQNLFALDGDRIRLDSGTAQVNRTLRISITAMPSPATAREAPPTETWCTWTPNRSPAESYVG